MVAGTGSDPSPRKEATKTTVNLLRAMTLDKLPSKCWNNNGLTMTVISCHVAFEIWGWNVRLRVLGRVSAGFFDGKGEKMLQRCWENVSTLLKPTSIILGISTCQKNDNKNRWDGHLASGACMVTHIARVWINRVRLPVLHVVS